MNFEKQKLNLEETFCNSFGEILCKAHIVFSLLITIRMRIGYYFTQVCLSVCVSVQAITFELL